MTLKIRSKLKFKVARRIGTHHSLYVRNWFLSSDANNKRDIRHFVQWPWKSGQRSNSRSPLESPYITSYLNVLLSKLYLEVFWVFSQTHPHYEAKSHWNFRSPKNFIEAAGNDSKHIVNQFRTIFFFVDPSKKQNGRRTETKDSRPIKLIHIIDILMAHVCAKIEIMLLNTFWENAFYRSKWPFSAKKMAAKPSWMN